MHCCRRTFLFDSAHRKTSLVYIRSSVGGLDAGRRQFFISAASRKKSSAHRKAIAIRRVQENEVAIPSLITFMKRDKVVSMELELAKQYNACLNRS